MLCNCNENPWILNSLDSSSSFVSIILYRVARHGKYRNPIEKVGFNMKDTLPSLQIAKGKKKKALLSSMLVGDYFKWRDFQKAR